MKNIGVFFGSRSAEHDISIITAQLIISGLKGLNYQVTPVYITKQGQWMIGQELGDLKMFTDPAKKVEDEKKFAEYYLDLEESVRKMVFKKKGLAGKTVTVDLAFPALHGTFGEDGTMQGLFEMLNVPYVGCGVPASAIAMDKAFTKSMMTAANVPTTKFIVLYKNEWEGNRQKVLSNIRQSFSQAVMVKPVHLGSSIGIGKVKNLSELDLENKLEVAFHYDDKAIVETAVENLMDVTCCVIGNQELRASLLQESVFKTDLFDFEDKYINEGGAQIGKGGSNLVIPARLPENITTKIQDYAKAVYVALGCSGIARVDFLVDKQTMEVYANEVNPLPGTLYHHLWKASGLELDQLLQELIKFAEERQQEKSQVAYTFESSVLKNLHGSKLKSNKLQ